MKYRLNSHRKPGWNYAADAMYFITLITQNRVCNLGKVVTEPNPVVELSDWGSIVQIEWLKSFNIRKELILDEYIIMPNHLHAIVILANHQDDIVMNSNVGAHGRAPLHLNRAPLHLNLNPETQPIHRSPQSISSFIAGFKSAVNSKIDDYIDLNNLNIPKYNRTHHFFQRNYYDHIIRNEQSYHHIKTYIQNNPAKWTNDTLNVSSH